MFFITACWIGFNLYNKSISSTISDTLSAQIRPIPAQFDTAIIDQLDARTKVDPVSSVKAPVTPPISPVVTPIAAPQTQPVTLPASASATEGSATP